LAQLAELAGGPEQDHARALANGDGGSCCDLGRAEVCAVAIDCYDRRV